MERWQPAYVGVGSNLDDPRARVLEACAHLARLPSTRLVLTSRLYASRPFGQVKQPDFVNAVAGLITQLDLEAFFQRLRDIETRMGRPAIHQHWGPRVIDLDLLAFGREQRRGEGLTLPHPGIVERNFVLYPLAEIAPDADLPGLGRISELAGKVTSEGLALL